MSEKDISYYLVKDDVLAELEKALSAVDEASVRRLIDEILAAEKVFFVGVGRVMLSLQAFAKRLAHLGISAHCVGDITEPAITERDLLIAGSGSGASIVPVVICHKAKELGARIVHIGSNENSEISSLAAFVVRIPVKTKLDLPDEIGSDQIMTSLFEQSLFLLGDIVAKMIAEEQRLDLDALWEKHANLE